MTGRPEPASQGERSGVGRLTASTDRVPANQRCWIRAHISLLTCHLAAEAAHGSGITQIYEGTNQIQRVVMARLLLK